MNFAGQVPEWSDSEAPAVEVTGGLPVLPVAGTRPAIFPPLFFAPSLLRLGYQVFVEKLSSSFSETTYL